MLVTPAAWLVQMGVTEALAAQSCFPYDHPSPAPASRGLDWSIACVGAVSSTLFLFALIATDSAVLIVSPCSRW